MQYAHNSKKPSAKTSWAKEVAYMKKEWSENDKRQRQYDKEAEALKSAGRLGCPDDIRKNIENIFKNIKKS